MLELTLLAGILLAILASSLMLGRTLGVTAVLLLSLTFTNEIIFVFQDSVVNFRTMAPQGWVLTVIGVVLLVSIFVVPKFSTLRLSPLPIWLMMGMLCYISATQLGFEPQIISGIQQWGLLAIAWGLGASLALSIRNGNTDVRHLTLLLSALIFLQAIGILLQLVGLREVSHVEDVGGSEIGRLKGWANHPADLGKILILYLVILLPITRSTDKVSSRLATGMTFLSLAMIGSTASRANLLAVIIAFIIWFVFKGKGSLLTRYSTLALGAIVIVFTLGPSLLRQSTDSEGGSRPELLATAFSQIEQTLVWGIGTNNYLTVVSQYDTRAANGLPVHNSFVLLLAELGLVAIIILAFPFLNLLIKVFKNLNKSSTNNTVAWAAVVFLPGLIVVLSTGHGMLAERIFPLFMLTCGYLSESLRPAYKLSPNKSARNQSHFEKHRYSL